MRRRLLVSYLTLTVFVLAFNVIGFAEGYLLRDFGLVWLVPILTMTAVGEVLASRRWSQRVLRVGR